MRKFLLVLFVTINSIANSQVSVDEIKISDDLQLLKITNNAFVVRSFTVVPKWGRVGANGFLYLKNKQATLINTPWDTIQTAQLCNYIDSVLEFKIVQIIITHSHNDCMGGLAVIKKRKIHSFTYKETLAKAVIQKLTIPDTSYSDSIYFKEINATAFFPGQGHTTDNSVVWFVNEKILYAGCLVKDINATNMGNIAEANLHDWPFTILNLLNKYSSINIVIPGHGEVGGRDLLEHTLQLSRK